MALEHVVAVAWVDAALEGPREAAVGGAVGESFDLGVVGSVRGIGFAEEGEGLDFAPT